MKKTSRADDAKRKPRVVRKSASELTAPTANDLGRLRRAMESAIDTTEISEARVGHAVRARHSGKEKPVRPPQSAIRDAIRGELGRREITRYELWKRARVHCPTLPESAVYEFLRGVRAIGLDYVEALLAAVDLEVRRREEAAPGAR